MIAVTGATGNVGRSLVRALAAAGEQVTVISRQTAGVDLPEGVRYGQADVSEPESLRPILGGATALYLLANGDDPHGILDVAKAAGVRRVVLVSSQGAGTRPDIYRQPRMFEDALRESGLDWTILRPGGFYSNTFMWAESVRAQRTAAAPFAEVGLPFIDPADIADVAAVTLRTDGHAGHVYELTGPAPVSPRQRAQAIGDALGEPVRFIEQSRDEARAQMLQFMPEPVVESTLAILGEPLEAELRVSSAVEQLLGRPPRAFADWAEQNIGAFR